MTEVEIIGEIDAKGRMTLTKELRERYGLKPKDRVRLKLIEAMPRKSFLKECTGLLEGEGDAVKLLHKKSPFRF
ncbi:MAG: AbrB/MazE/SpoVT family DNA-binding domain-containing protein [Euryarchaeota archaeon]|nr:AbrB/MazE/SpoVT family DNA-binding domain-containing protein [Euryarchaeota archaeon]